MAYAHILATSADGIATVTLNRPQVLNALNQALMEELATAMEALDHDAAVRCLVVTGNDRAFAAGADVHEFADASTADMVRAYRFHQWDRIRRIGKPVIAAVRGQGSSSGAGAFICGSAPRTNARGSAPSSRSGRPTSRGDEGGRNAWGPRARGGRVHGLPPAPPLLRARRRAGEARVCRMDVLGE